MKATTAAYTWIQPRSLGLPKNWATPSTTASGKSSAYKCGGCCWASSAVSVWDMSPPSMPWGFPNVTVV